ncbi:hypothetical protein B0H14DRAFT_3857732 [Mycena olivaceomarginata]|nr:hypothetical protein B0H14DRAFT_3857732 [Mycena olivaceomarginata]
MSSLPAGGGWTWDQSSEHLPPLRVAPRLLPQIHSQSAALYLCPNRPPRHGCIASRLSSRHRAYFPASTSALSLISPTYLAQARASRTLTRSEPGVALAAFPVPRCIEVEDRIRIHLRLRCTSPRHLIRLRVSRRQEKTRYTNCGGDGLDASVHVPGVYPEKRARRDADDVHDALHESAVLHLSVWHAHTYSFTYVSPDGPSGSDRDHRAGPALFSSPACRRPAHDAPSPSTSHAPVPSTVASLPPVASNLSWILGGCTYTGWRVPCGQATRVALPFRMQQRLPRRVLGVQRLHFLRLGALLSVLPFSLPDTSPSPRPFLSSPLRRFAYLYCLRTDNISLPRYTDGRARACLHTTAEPTRAPRRAHLHRVELSSCTRPAPLPHRAGVSYAPAAGPLYPVPTKATATTPPWRHVLDRLQTCLCRATDEHPRIQHLPASDVSGPRPHLSLLLRLQLLHLLDSPSAPPPRRHVLRRVRLRPRLRLPPLPALALLPCARVSVCAPPLPGVKWRVSLVGGEDGDEDGGDEDGARGEMGTRSDREEESEND